MGGGWCHATLAKHVPRAVEVQTGYYRWALSCEDDSTFVRIVDPAFLFDLPWPRLHPWVGREWFYRYRYCWWLWLCWWLMLFLRHSETTSDLWSYGIRLFRISPAVIYYIGDLTPCYYWFAWYLVSWYYATTPDLWSCDIRKRSEPLGSDISNRFSYQQISRYLWQL